MKVMYDGEIFSSQKVGGISRYFIDLASHVSETEKVYFQIRKSKNLYYDRYEKIHSPFISRFRIIKRIKKLFNPELLRLIYLWVLRPDILHLTYYNTKYLKLKPKSTKVVVTVHDMIHELFPEQFPQKDRTSKNKRDAVELADSVIAISNQTKKDLVSFFNLNESKVSVVYHGCMFSNTFDESIKITLPKLFVLFVGSRAGYKNFKFFINSVSELILEEGIQVVCAGGGSFNQDEVSFLGELGINQFVNQYFFSDSELKIAYKKSLCLVYPSLYEGFGLPILEAWSLETPLILSRASCFPEIAGDGALYFEPGNGEMISDHIRFIMSNESAVESVIVGKERLKQFSINNMVKATKNVYENA
tara:strand:+ start:2553 stop:3635 length:1083 start_codon:yes stop_codon:yes gene_type:complete